MDLPVRVLCVGCAPPREVDGFEVRVIPLGPEGRSPAPWLAPQADRVVVLAAGAGAAQVARWLARPAWREQLDAVLLIHPHLGRQEDAGRALEPWLELATEAQGRGGPLLAIWAAYNAPPPARGARHPYDGALLLLEALKALPGLGPPGPVDAAAVPSWAPGELLCGPRGVTWGAFPRLQWEQRGSFALVVDLETTDEPEGLAQLVAPGALVRGFLAPRMAQGLRRHARATPAADAPAAAELQGAAEEAGRVAVRALAQGRRLVREGGALVEGLGRVRAALRGVLGR